MVCLCNPKALNNNFPQHKPGNRMQVYKSNEKNDTISFCEPLNSNPLCSFLAILSPIVSMSMAQPSQCDLIDGVVEDWYCVVLLPPGALINGEQKG